MKIRSVALSRALTEEMNKRRRAMQRKEDVRYQEVCSHIPQIREMDNDLKCMTYDIGKRIMGNKGGDDVHETAQMFILSQQEERNKLLTQNGFPIDYLDKQYVCELCHDTGRIGKDLCKCVIQLAINTAFEDSGIDPKQSFENFDINLQKTPTDRIAMTKIRDAAITYADSFPDTEKRDLLYFGEPGVGKTFLVNCIGGRILKRGYSVLKLSAHRLIQLTLDTLRTDPIDRPDFILPDLLIIDDLGTEPMIRNITIETLLSILCQRQDMNKATVVSTNLDVLSSGSMSNDTIWSVYGERFASRLMAPKTVKIQAIHTENVRLVQQ